MSKTRTRGRAGNGRFTAGKPHTVPPPAAPPAAASAQRGAPVPHADVFDQYAPHPVPADPPHPVPPAVPPAATSTATPVPPAAPPVPPADADAADAGEQPAADPAAVPPAPAALPAPRSEVELAAERARLDEIEREAALKARKHELAVAALEQKAALLAAERARAAELAELAAQGEQAALRESATARRWQTLGKRVRATIAGGSLRLRRLAVNVGVTGAAVFGQWQYLLNNTELGNPGSAVVSILVELLAVSVLDHAHRRRRAGLSSWLLYVIAACMAVGVGVANFAHWDSEKLAPVGMLFFAFSIAGPLLWSLTTLESELGTAAERKPTSAKFRAEQWVLFPRATFGAKRLAVRHGIVDAAAALDLHAERREARHAERRARRGRAPVQATAPAPMPAPVPAVDGDEGQGDATPAAYELELVPSVADLETMTARDKQAAARATARKALAAGYALTGEELGKAYKLSERWGRIRLAEVRQITAA